MSVILKRNWIPAVIVAAFVGMLWWIGSARGVSEYYASTTGSGTTCSFAAPCSLSALTYGAVKNLLPGDIVWVRGGTYIPTAAAPFEIWAHWNGTESQPITFRNYNNEHWVIDCKELNPSNDCIGIHGGYTRYIRFWGFDMTNSSTASIMVNTDCVTNPTTMSEVILPGGHNQVINSFISAGGSGILETGGPYGQGNVEGGNLVYGNFFQYNGAVGTPRGCGHWAYIQNPQVQCQPDGSPPCTLLDESYRSTWRDNVGIRGGYDLGIQVYGGSGVSFVTMDNNVDAEDGHPPYPTTTWWPKGTNLKTEVSWGANGSPSNGPLSSDKQAYKGIFSNNLLYSSGSTGNMFWGFQKGTYDSQITDNLFFGTGASVITCVAGNGDCDTCNHCPVGTYCGTYAPIVIERNTFLHAPGGTQGRVCSAPDWTIANYPNNTYLSARPTSGKVWKIRPNQFEAGRGWLALVNWDQSATVTITAAQMAAAGCYAGEQWKMFNGQDNNPWDSTPIKTGTGCGDVTGVPTTLAAGSIRQPPYTTDGSTPFPKPWDLGPEFVVYFLYPDWGTSPATPTATSTYTPSNTPTLTPSNTPTATFTPSVTNTPSATSTASPTPSLTPTATFTPSLTPTPNTTPNPNQNSFSVASCTATLPMVVQADAGAFGGYSASSITGNYGKLECPFSVTADGLYRVWTHVYGPSSTEDSFFLDVDGDSLPDGMTDGDTTNPHIFDIAEQHQPCTGTQTCNYIANRTGWWWNPMNDRTATCGSCTGNFAERDLTLTAGSHTLSLRTRDHNSKIAWIIVTADFGYEPGAPAPPTPTPTLTPTGTITPAPSNTPTSTGTITANPTRTPTRTPLPGTCRKWIQCNGKGAFIEAPCSQIKNRRPPIPCPW